MSRQPVEGPISPNYGPYLRNIQPIIEDKLWVADGQRGTMGKGKQWLPLLVRRNPEAGQPRWRNHPTIQDDFEECGFVRHSQGWRKGHTPFKFAIYVNGGVFLEGYVKTDAEALDLLLLNAKELFK